MLVRKRERKKTLYLGGSARDPFGRERERERTLRRMMMLSVQVMALFPESQIKPTLSLSLGEPSKSHTIYIRDPSTFLLKPTHTHAAKGRCLNDKISGIYMYNSATHTQEIVTIFSPAINNIYYNKFDT